jgi:hypothetical protein
VATADEPEVPGVTEAAAADWFGAALLLLVAAVAGFLQADKPSAKTNGRSANRMSINEVMAFSLPSEKNKRFLAQDALRCAKRGI